MTSKLRILIVDDEAPARYGMAKALRLPGYEIIEAENGQVALELLREQAIDLTFLDLNMPQLDGRGVLRELAGQGCRSEIIVVTANDTVQAAVECIQLGAADYLTKPYEIERVRALARRAAARRQLEARVATLQTSLEEQTAYGALVGGSLVMRELFGQVERAARADLCVLVHGETGTGKELIAREIHRSSPRAPGPFVAVNTAAISESLAESELFGHVRGAFTGADADRQSVFEQAQGGTLFLDEIGDMPLPAQAKILRALQDRTIQRVGSPRTIPIDVRIVSATHQDLDAAISAGLFRKDLYYRIRGIELQVPPLRTRREDILPLVRHFLERQAGASAAPKTLSAEAAKRLLVHNWPGNVRELEQVVLAAAAMSAGDEIQATDLRLATSEQHDARGIDAAELLGLPLTEAKNRLVEDFERRAITAALSQHEGNVSAAARQLGIHRQNLQQKMSQLGIARN